MTDDEWVTVAEVAARFRVTKMTVYRMVESGELEATRFGRSLRISAESVDAHASRPTHPYAPRVSFRDPEAAE